MLNTAGDFFWFFEKYLSLMGCCPQYKDLRAAKRNLFLAPDADIDHILKYIDHIFGYINHILKYIDHISDFIDHLVRFSFKT
jgi:hypothetical protein